MAEVSLSIGGRQYSIACRDGGEDHLKTIAAHVDRKAVEARGAVGDMNEVRQMLFAALLLADELAEAQAGTLVAKPDPMLEQQIHTLAVRLENVANVLEASA